MATPRVKAPVTSSWTNVAGAAASIPGVTWQNIGYDNVRIAFQAAQPIATDPYVVLKTFDAFYDKTGSAGVWVMTDQFLNGATVTAISE